MVKLTIKDPEVLKIVFNMNTYYGATQSWYQTNWQRKAGCGPTTLSNLIIYYAKTHINNNILFDKDTSYANVLSFMNEMWNYAHPTILGVNKPEIIKEGLINYGKSKKTRLFTNILKIKKNKLLRPSLEEIINYLKKALINNSAVAFLNLSAGKLTNLDDWHWVLIISLSYNKDDVDVEIMDQGELKIINLKEWLLSTRLGGSFIYIERAELIK
ncbi:MAG: hypothetical protein LBT75_01725 [Bacilli bacterium]|jgi:hypothetical protein|nr:hypothetical protein [Bacilli bacterium]